jgi:hypothetical protein
MTVSYVLALVPFEMNKTGNLNNTRTVHLVALPSKRCTLWCDRNSYDAWTRKSPNYISGFQNQSTESIGAVWLTWDFWHDNKSRLTAGTRGEGATIVFTCWVSNSLAPKLLPSIVMLETLPVIFVPSSLVLKNCHIAGKLSLPMFTAIICTAIARSYDS